MTVASSGQLPWSNPERVAALESALARRILVIDGAMGTMIQRHELQEADYRGERFAHGYDALSASDGHALISERRAEVDALEAAGSLSAGQANALRDHSTPRCGI